MASFIVTDDEIQYPVTSVTPQRCVMVQTKCAYTGVINDSIMFTPLPNCMHNGIFHTKEYTKNAKKDCFDHCVAHKIYPLHKLVTHIKENGKCSENVIIKRTNGDLENDWHLDLLESARYSDHYDTILICVYHPQKNISKGVSISDLAVWNDLEVENIMACLTESLNELYSVDDSKDEILTN